MSHAEQLANLIASYESRAAKLRALQKLLGDDPELIAELRAVLFPPEPAPPSVPAIEAVVGYFEAKSGEWLTARQIAEGTNLPRNTVNFLLFTSKHKERFESEMHGPKRKVWRLKDRIVRLPKKPKPVKESGKMGTD